MNALDFDFLYRQKSNPAESARKAARGRCSKRGAPAPVADAFPLTVNECERFLHIVAQTSRIKRHYELFQLLQGEEIQHFLPHQILISTWGDFGGPCLKFDVISAIPGVRTGLLHRCTIDGLLKDLYKRWLAQGRHPLLLDSTMNIMPAHSACGCALHKSFQGAWSLMVHGVIDARDGNDSLYVALNPTSMVNGHGIERFRLLADPLITQLDAAFRRIAALKFPADPANQEFPPALPALSAREEEILRRVSEGKTNLEISEIFTISPFTVKNHMQRIMKKLNAANRTEAVAKHRQLGTKPPAANTAVATNRDGITRLYA